MIVVAVLPRAMGVVMCVVVIGRRAVVVGAHAGWIVRCKGI